MEMPNGPDICFREFGVNIGRTSTVFSAMKARLPTMANVLTACDVFQVLNTVVSLDSVLVIDLNCRFCLTQKRSCHSSMNFDIAGSLAWNHHFEERITFRVATWGQHSATLSPGRFGG